MKKLSVITIFIFLFFLLTYSQPFLYILPITLHNGGSTKQDVQVLVRFNTANFINAGMMNANGSDIRFYSNSSLSSPLSFYLEGFMNTDSTKLWVLMPVLPSGNTTIYCNFGNQTAISASTLSIFEGPYSSTNYLSGGNSNTTSSAWNSVRGYKFMSSKDLLVTDFGKFEPNGNTRILTMWNASSQQIVKQHHVSGGASVWSHNKLDQAFWIKQGVEYIMSIFQANGDGYFYQSSSQLRQDLTYMGMSYCNSCNQNSYPSGLLPNYHYGYADFMYYKRNSVLPVPTYTIGSVVTGISGNNGTAPGTYEIYQNYPNPFNPSTTIKYDIPKGSVVKLTVYDALGRETARLVNEYKNPGTYESVWNAVNQSSGIYFYRIEAGDFTKQVKMILVK